MATQRCNLPLSYDLETLFDDTESSDETSADMVFSTDAVADHNSRTARPVPRLSNLDCCRSVSSTISVHNAQCRRSVSSTIPVPDQQVSDAVVPCIEGSILEGGNPTKNSCHHVRHGIPKEFLSVFLFRGIPV